MMAAALLSELRDLGILVRVVGTRLDLDAPRGVLGDALLARLREAKPALITLLAAESECDEAELFEERCAIREYDGRLSRPLAERLARRDVAEWFNPPDLSAVTLARVAALFDAEPVAHEAVVLTSDEEQVSLARGGVR